MVTVSVSVRPPADTASVTTMGPAVVGAVNVGLAIFALTSITPEPAGTVQAYDRGSPSESLEPEPSSVTVAPGATI